MNTNTQNQNGVYHAGANAGQSVSKLDYMRDGRDKEKFFNDLTWGVRQEPIVIDGLKEYHRRFNLYATRTTKINPAELSGFDSSPEYKRAEPDYIYTLQTKWKTYDYALEIKANRTDHYINDEVFIKCGAVNAMFDDRIKYPNGQLVVATTTVFAWMPVDDIVRYPVEVRWEKPHYIIPVEKFNWKKFITPLVWVQ